MIVTRTWLQEFIDISKLDTNNICTTFNAIGLEVDSLNKIRIPEGVVIGFITSKEKHPDADKLSVIPANAANPSGAANYVQYSDGANFASSIDFQWDDVAKELTAGDGKLILKSPVGTTIRPNIVIGNANTGAAIAGLQTGNTVIGGYNTFALSAQGNNNTTDYDRAAAAAKTQDGPRAKNERKQLTTIKARAPLMILSMRVRSKKTNPSRKHGRFHHVPTKREVCQVN